MKIFNSFNLANSTREAMKKVGILPVLTECMTSPDVAIRHLARDCTKYIIHISEWSSEDSDESYYSSDDEDTPSDNGDDSDEDSEEDMFFGDIKKDIEALKRDNSELESEIACYKTQIQEDEEYYSHLKANFKNLSRQLEKRYITCLALFTNRI